ncbi:hypothetical protein VTI74DRAFT_1440 [Chaetomium olivicolor]
MADHHHNANWLRNLAHSRSSTPTSFPTACSFQVDRSHTRNGHHFPHDSHTHTPAAPPTTDSSPRHRKSATSTMKHVSSFLSLKNRSHGTPSAAEADIEAVPGWTPAPLAMLPLTDVEWDVETKPKRGKSPRRRDTGDSFPGADREKASAWYNPTALQMAETLTAVLGGGRAQEGLPVAYNSCILVLIEGFYKLTAKLRDTEEELGELKVLRELELEQFRSMTEEWMETSKNYKAEVKRLELALANESKDGTARVALARHGSLVDRAGSKRFHARLQALNNKQAQAGTTRGESLSADDGLPSPTSPRLLDLAEATTSYRTLDVRPRILDNDNDVLVSRIVEQRELEERRFLQQQQQQGRVRAGPVIVRRESHDPQTGNGGFRNTFMDRDAYREAKRAQAAEQASIYAGATPRVKPRFELPSDGDSTSSGSGASTETGDELQRGTAKLFDPLKIDLYQGSNSKGAWSTPISSTANSGAATPQSYKIQSFMTSVASGNANPGEGGETKPKPRRPHLLTAARRSFQDLRHRRRERRYSFEKGGDDVITVTSPASSNSGPGPSARP